LLSTIKLKFDNFKKFDGFIPSLNFFILFLAATSPIFTHSPWKPHEIVEASILKSIFYNQSYIEFVSHQYHFSSLILLKYFSEYFEIHNLMRFTNIFWNLLIIIFIGLSSKELFNRSVKYFSQLIFVSSFGILIPFHLFNSELITLCGFLILFYSFCLAPRRKNLSYFFFGISLFIISLVNIQNFILVFLFVCFIICLSQIYRSEWFFNFIFFGFIFYLILKFLFLIFFAEIYNSEFNLNASFFFSFKIISSLHENILSFDDFFKNIVYSFWPSWPFALWSLWIHRNSFFVKREFQVLIAFFLSSILYLVFFASLTNDVILILNVTLSILAASCLDKLPKTFRNLSYFFSLIFISIGFIIVILFYNFNFLTKIPSLIHTSFFSFIAILILYLSWIILNLIVKKSIEKTITLWSSGIVIIWLTFNILYINKLDIIKSYKPIASSISNAMHDKSNCLNTFNLGHNEIAMVKYYTKLTPTNKKCDYLLTLNSYPNSKYETKLLWSGTRLLDKSNIFRLYLITKK